MIHDMVANKSLHLTAVPLACLSPPAVEQGQTGAPWRQVSLDVMPQKDK